MGRSRLVKNAGFTLLEMVIVLVLVGIMGASVAVFITQPLAAYDDLARRLELVDQADLALRRMARDIRRALPDSVRAGCLIGGNRTCIEFAQTVDGGRYRAAPADDGSSNDILDFDTTDDSFDVLGELDDKPSAGQWVVVNNRRPTEIESNFYLGDNRAIVDNGSSSNMIRLQPAFQFPQESPNQRFFIVNTPVSYFCRNGRLTRHDGYVPPLNQAVVPPNDGDLLSNRVESCDFVYDGNTATVTLTLVLSRNDERIRLLHQVHVDNRS